MTDPNKSADAQPVAWGYAHSMWKTRDISRCLSPPRISAKQTLTHKLPVYLAPPDMDALRAALRTIAEMPFPEQDDMIAANMRAIARAALEGKNDD